MSSFDTITTTSPEIKKTAPVKATLETLRAGGKIDAVTYKKIKEQLDNLEGLGLSLQQETKKLDVLKKEYEKKRIEHTQKQSSKPSPKEKDTPITKTTSNRSEQAKTKKADTTPKPNKLKRALVLGSVALGTAIAASGLGKNDEGNLEWSVDHMPGANKTIEYFSDSEGAPQKVAFYAKNAPWGNPSELPEYFKRVNDTRNRSHGEDIVQAPIYEGDEQNVEPDSTKSINPYTGNALEPVTEELKKKSKKLDENFDTAQKKFYDENNTLDDVNEQLDEVIKTLGGNRIKFHPTDVTGLLVGELYEDDIDGLHGRSIIDMSNGSKVIYQPRNFKSAKRSDVHGVALISDYLYDMDFTDDYWHDHAETNLRHLHEKVTNKDFSDGRKFVQVREPVDGQPGVYNVRVKEVTELTDQDFEQNNVYRQSWARLSDFDITPDGTKIKLTNYAKKFDAALFQDQGLPFHAGIGSEHNLRLPGGKKNFGTYQNIANLDMFGAYVGATVIIISDDGRIAKKVTGSLRDIITIALEIQKLTGGKDVHFLQSDSGSMNVKAVADKSGTILKKQLGITRNLEPFAGGSELLLKDQR